jgi:hypothetical protein
MNCSLSQHRNLIILMFLFFAEFSFAQTISVSGNLICGGSVPVTLSISWPNGQNTNNSTVNWYSSPSGNSVGSGETVTVSSIGSYYAVLTTLTGYETITYDCSYQNSYYDGCCYTYSCGSFWNPSTCCSGCYQYYWVYQTCSYQNPTYSTTTLSPVTVSYSTEICNNIDDNCDTQIDEGFTFTNYYADVDLDGYGSGAATNICAQPEGYVTDNTDCDDNSASVQPGATEICNSIDDNCDTQIDEGVQNSYYADTDGDGYGSGIATLACTAPTGYVTDNTDCDNTNAAVNTAATEVCNSIDDDCDTQIDEGFTFINYYADVDSDGYGAGTATLVCSAPAGYVTESTDCNDNSSAVNPGATEICNGIDDNCSGSADEGIALNTYYNDADGDGYGAGLATTTCAILSAQYVSNNTDCDDTNMAINTAATESCLNSIDDNCNGTVNENCGSDYGAGESPATAQYVWTNFFPSCVTQSHTLAGSSPSSASQSICLTGEDKWHYFTATSEAVSIVVASSANNILLELQSNTGVLLATENAVSGLGGEILNFSGLTAGQIYKVGVRNYNSDLGIGAYTICVKMLKRGGCDYGPGPYTLCQYFKASYAGTGAVYTFTFTGTSGSATGNVYTRTQSSDICVLSNVSPSLPYGSTYNVLITSTYTLLDGAGNQEVIAVPGLSPCTMSTVTQPATSLRTSDQCANGTRFRGSVVASLPWVCGVTNWRWEFTEVNPLTYATVGLPIALNRGAASNYINLGTVAALQNGKTYAVRTAPILASTGSDYQWGTIKYMCIIGSAGMVVENNNTPAADTKSEIANEANMSLYPNPTHGTDVNINLSGVTSDNVQIRVVDAMGRQVWSNRYVVNQVLNTNITFEQPLANGLYFVEAIYNGELQTQRLMVQK